MRKVALWALLVPLVLFVQIMCSLPVHAQGSVPSIPSESDLADQDKQRAFATQVLYTQHGNNIPIVGMPTATYGLSGRDGRTRVILVFGTIRRNGVDFPVAHEVSLTPVNGVYPVIQTFPARTPELPLPILGLISTTGTGSLLAVRRRLRKRFALASTQPA